MISNILSKTGKSTSGLDQKWERFERKFFIQPTKAAFARSLLSHICLPDSRYPQGTISSLYFDTPELDNFQKSDNGDYEREKIRIRWYDNTEVSNGMVPVYLELKSKRGFASRKQRRRILVPAERLKKISPGNTIMDRNVISSTLSGFGCFSRGPLIPVILITYKRLRFIEILTGVRLSFDWKVCSVIKSPILGHSRTNLMLEGGIIEVKGPSMEIPESLRSINYLGTDWTRFSKYAGCLESQMERSGSVGRLWPSGRVELI
jgi:hypothetical protein